jgi:hypothetical protein
MFIHEVLNLIEAKEKMMKTTERRSNYSILTISLLTVLFLVLLGGVDRAQAQWSSSGGNTTTTDNVGIGITTGTTVTEKLHVSSTGSSTYTAIKLSDTASGGRDYGLVVTDSANGNGGGKFGIYDFTASSYRLTIDSSGNVGVGTTSPAAKLAFGTSLGVGAKIHLFDDTATNRYGLGIQAGEMQLFVPAAGHFSFNRGGDIQTSGTNELMRITGGGNVGIGTTSPGNKLQVGSGSGALSAWTATAYDATDASFAAYNTAGSTTTVLDSNSHLGILGTYSNDPLTIRTSNTDRIRIDTAGNVGIGTTTPDSSYKLDVNGSVKVSGNISAKFQDVAEWVPATHALPAGTVVILNPTKSNEVMASTSAYDTRVAGVVSERPGLALGEEGKDKVLVATTGRVRIKVDASKAPIHIGDLLVTSDVEGVAMKSEPVDLGGVKIHRPGTLIGKALEPLESGKDEILVLLSLQ